MSKDHHIPVLLAEVVHYLDPKPGQSYLDATSGYGGHAQSIIGLTHSPDKAVLVDRDANAAKELKKRFEGDDVKVIHQDFLTASRELASSNHKFDMILADLGVSSPHLDEASRGFSFALSGPLDMRMDVGQELTAGKILNEWNEAEIARILKEFGQEPKAAAIARRVVAARPLTTTDQLAAITKQAWPGHSRVHPATRTFQALRIAVNGELLQLQDSLPVWTDLLEPGGRLAIISFHSLEDRVVKEFLAEHAANNYGDELTSLTKKPITAGPEEIASNPRARSAKLRAAAKIKTKKKG